MLTRQWHQLKNLRQVTSVLWLKAPAGKKTGEAKLREENKRLRAEVRGLKKGGPGEDKKASGPKESMKDKMARLRGNGWKEKEINLERLVIAFILIVIITEHSHC